MAEFVPKPGCVICDKCGGWQVLDYTKRNKANMSPIGPLDYRDCDKCNGAGEIRVEPLPKFKTKSGRKPKVGIDIDASVPPPSVEAMSPEPKFLAPQSCWHINKKEVWGKTVCADCGKELLNEIQT